MIQSCVRRGAGHGGRGDRALRCTSIRGGGGEVFAETLGLLVEGADFSVAVTDFLVLRGHLCAETADLLVEGTDLLVEGAEFRAAGAHFSVLAAHFSAAVADFSALVTELSPR